ncbi:site-specific tyrosine recombinase/integron integrase [Brevibacillus laterosporus]|uniref:site-specific tyrosine recombinase/integron integrase n=1 Tax=Brevibacillus laterosporus TaxID=1465 RepID=UPI003D1CE4FF
MIFIKNFHIYLRTNGTAKSTIENYVRDSKSFLSFSETPKDVFSITPTHIRTYLIYLEDIGRKKGTIGRVVCSLRSFFAYLVQEKIISENPAKSVAIPKKDKNLPKYISEAEVRAIIDAATQTSLKNRLLVELLYGSGGRVSEITSLKIDGIDFDSSFLDLFGKGSKERSNPIHEQCIVLIKQYMDAYGIKSGYLFPHATDPNRHMTRENVLKTVKKMAKKAGIDPSKVSPHVLRHSFATHLLDNGADMAYVQELLGHEDIATTKIYAKITKTNKKNSYAKFHPLASQSNAV